MATWDDLKTDVFTWTNKPKLIPETELALRQAIRTAHRQAKFWRDLAVIQTTQQSTDATIQQIDLETECPRFKQIAYVKSATSDKYYDEATVKDLVDLDNIARTDIYWGVGNTLNIRAYAPEEYYEIAYYTQPITTPPESIDDWLLANYKDVVVLFAAGTILGTIGEQEIKQRVDQLLVIEVAGLIADQNEITGR